MAPAQGWHANSWSVPYFFASCWPCCQQNIPIARLIATTLFLFFSFSVVHYRFEHLGLSKAFDIEFAPPPSLLLITTAVNLIR